MLDCDEIKKTYESYWNLWYQGTNVSKARLEIIEFDGTDTNSGYSHRENLIRLNLSEDAIPTDLYNPALWPMWKKELVHEMIHEYQFKVIKNTISEKGRKLHLQFGKEFPEPGHGEDFFTAVTYIAMYLNVEPEQLIKVI